MWTFFYFPASDPMRNYGTRDAFLLWISGDDTDPDPGIYRIFYMGDP